jgi:metal-responsive CopG/Arc/MetJ family transcriptional regulator
MPQARKSRHQPDDRRYRQKVSVTVDPELLGAVDAFVAEHADYDRSAVIGDALFLWYAQQQDRAMAAQYLADSSEADAEEHSAWERIRSDTTKRLFDLA